MFWDSSSLVPILIDEEGSAEMFKLLDEDRAAAIWWATPVECTSAIQRRHREKSVSRDERDLAAIRLRDIQSGFRVVPAVEIVKARAIKVLSAHPLRAADAMQLAAALVWCEENPKEQDFVCLDKRLRESAGREGFRVLPAG